METQIPRFGAIFVKNIAVHDLQAVRSQEMLIVIHDLQFHEHAFFDGIDKFPGFRAGQIFLLEPVGDREAPAGLQELSGRSKDPFAALIVGEGFYRPEKVELLLKVHRFGVHKEKLGIELRACRSLGGHFDLYRGNGYAGDGGVIVLGQIKTAGAEAAPNVKNIRAGLYLYELGERLDELKLGRFLGFISTNPIAVMQMLSPEGAIVGTDDVVGLDDSMLIV